jgi:Ni/Co efflux regulator RcnB
MIRLTQWIAVHCVLAMSFSSIGCQGNSSDRYKPERAKARQAVETAMSQWKSGVKYGMASDATPAVIVEESRWKSGVQLESYEIVEELVSKDYPRFQVKLNLVDKPEVMAEYIVVGTDPPIVYSKEEYEPTSGKTSGM